MFSSRAVFFLPAEIESIPLYFASTFCMTLYDALVHICKFLAFSVATIIDVKSKNLCISQIHNDLYSLT